MVYWEGKQRIGSAVMVSGSTIQIHCSDSMNQQRLQRHLLRQHCQQNYQSNSNGCCNPDPRPPDIVVTNSLSVGALYSSPIGHKRKEMLDKIGNGEMGFIIRWIDLL